MKTRDLTELAIRNLREAILRNSLTTLGVAVGVASLVAMLSLGVGLQELANKRLSGSGLFDAIFITPRSNFRGFGGQPRTNSSPAVPSLPLDEDARQKIAQIPNVIEVYPEIRFFHRNSFRRETLHHYRRWHAGLLAKCRFLRRNERPILFLWPAADEAILAN